MPRDIGGLVGADETLHHQSVDTFARVGTTDVNWTEKIWTALSRVDGSLQVSFGVGKYPNRNVLDAFVGVSRGVEQWAIRGSRELGTAPDLVAIGPIRYDVIEPLSRVRLQLDRNDVVPLSFDLEFHSRLPAFFEERDVQYDQFRQTSNIIRFHQAGTATGCITFEGEQIDVDPTSWFASRDRSWGVRELVGIPPPDLQPSHQAFGTRFQFHWFTSQLQRPDGSWYELHYHLRQTEAGYVHFSAYLNEADGTQVRVTELVPTYRYRAGNRDFLGGAVVLRLEDGTKRTLEVDPVGDSGFHLHAGGYWPWNGSVFGSWRGEDHLEGEYLADASTVPPQAASALGWQVRDRPVTVREGDAVGFGFLESICFGDWPDIEFVEVHDGS